MKRIAFTGDMGFSSKYFRGTYNKENLLDEECVNFLSDSDFTVVNVEGCMGSGTSSASKPLVHANPPECLPFLKKINGNIWTLANNHITDCGREGVESTLDYAAENGVQTVGIGLNMTQAEKPIIIKNELVKFPYLYPKYKDYSKWQWFKFYLKRSKTSARNRGIISGNLMYCLNLWRFGDKS